jgi:RHS repeat-associated protein
MLARSSGYSSGTGNWSTHYYYYSDGNGNITYLVTSSQGLGASYRYDPFGNTISVSGGSLTNDNVYRFSSKEILVNSGLYYYGYRLYDPSLQRWLNKDPLGERGGFNLYTIVSNDPLQDEDPFGLDESRPPSDHIPPIGLTGYGNPPPITGLGPMPTNSPPVCPTVPTKPPPKPPVLSSGILNTNNSPHIIWGGPLGDPFPLPGAGPHPKGLGGSIGIQVNF